MRGKTRWIFAGFLVLIILFGIATLHFNFGPDQHHVQWAQQRGLPQPSKGLFVMGAAITVVASVALGWLLGRRGSTGP